MYVHKSLFIITSLQDDILKERFFRFSDSSGLGSKYEIGTVYNRKVDAIVKEPLDFTCKGPLSPKILV